jgi:hypothetical protein
VATPNWDGWLASVWGVDVPGPDFGCLPPWAGASNIVVGQNPPFTIQDFLPFFPKWGGVPLTPTATTVAGSTAVTLGAANPAIVVGNPLAGAGIPNGALVAGINGTDLTLSIAATASASGVTLAIWNAPIIPFVVLAAYVNLASASLVQARWVEQWTFAVCLYVAHFASLYAKSDGKANATASQAAAQALSTGINVAKSAGDVSVTFQPVGGLERWGQWNLTTYGQQLATMAKLIGAGPMVVW